jgi:1-acyl-sn-glycerol-3-phosphate acyltransferase
VSFLSLIYISIQRWIGWIVVIPLCLLIILIIKVRGRFKIINLQKVRAEFQRVAKDRTKPLIVCANHLTLIDSVIMLWAFAGPTTYFFNYKLFCWNLPAVENTVKKFSWRVITYLSKCMLVDRMGDSDHTGSIIEKICYLLKRGDIFMLFPEGTRSRSGRVNPEAVNYGIGKILQQMPECNVLCVYLRGKGQETYSDFPRCDEVFDFKLELLSPKSEKKGLRGIKDLSVQVISKLKQMEDEYFAVPSAVNSR